MSRSADSAAWRAWAESASPDLLEQFNRNSLETVSAVRRTYPADCGPNHPAYQEMKSRCSCELRQLAESIQEEHDNAEY